MSENLPEAYKRGYQEFYGRNFIVTPDVLIPRPETEQMIDMVLAMSGKAYLPGVLPEKAILSEKARILDVGTGSGCIGITVALELPHTEVTAIDISEKGLEIAKENAKKMGAKVKFAQSDLLDKVKVADFDVILANLPYVDKKWKWTSPELKYEPKEALFANDGGLALIKKFLKQMEESFLRCSEKKLSVCHQLCYLLLEADPCQHQRVIQYAKKCGFEYQETKGFVLRFSFSVCKNLE